MFMCTIELIFFSVVDVGFVRLVYTASESDMSATVCAEVKQGTLGIPVNFSLTTHSGSAQGTHTRTQCHTCSYRHSREQSYHVRKHNLTR